MITENELKHIEWIYYRMIFQHKEKPNYDYMLKFREVMDKIWEDIKPIERGCGDDYPVITPQNWK